MTKNQLCEKLTDTLRLYVRTYVPGHTAVREWNIHFTNGMHPPNFVIMEHGAYFYNMVKSLIYCM
jgi:hypothetical protein